MNTQYTPKILIVDDVARNIQVVANYLRKNGNYKISFAKDGKTAIKHTVNQNFDLILLDIMMPEMDGFQVCEQLKANPETASVPIIFLTARTEEDSIVKGFEIGAVDYITKPFNKLELLARVKTHLRLRNTEHQLRESNQTKDRLFSIIGHDLRAPIGNLKAMLDLVVENGKNIESDKMHELLVMAKRSAGLTFDLLENLLSWSKSQRNLLKYTPEELNLTSLISENILLLNTNAHSKNIKIYNNVPKNVFVKADKNTTTTIIRNLLSNAIKFTPADGQISISAHNFDDEFVEITVKDTGVGIEEEHIPKIFDENFHLSTYGTGNEKGSGLGLKLCKEFVENNGGTIRFESKKGSGTSFFFTLKKVGK